MQAVFEDRQQVKPFRVGTDREGKILETNTRREEDLWMNRSFMSLRESLGSFMGLLS